MLGRYENTSLLLSIQDQTVASIKRQWSKYTVDIFFQFGGQWCLPIENSMWHWVHFYLNCTSNTRIWAAEYFYAVEELPLKPSKQFLCFFAADFTVGPFLSENINEIEQIYIPFPTDDITIYALVSTSGKVLPGSVIFYAGWSIGRPVQQMLRQHFTQERMISRIYFSCMAALVPGSNSIQFLPFKF